MYNLTIIDYKIGSTKWGNFVWVKKGWQISFKCDFEMHIMETNHCFVGSLYVRSQKSAALHTCSVNSYSFCQEGTTVKYSLLVTSFSHCLGAIQLNFAFKPAVCGIWEARFRLTTCNQNKTTAEYYSNHVFIQNTCYSTNVFLNKQIAITGSSILFACWVRLLKRQNHSRGNSTGSLIFFTCKVRLLKKKQKHSRSDWPTPNASHPSLDSSVSIL